MTNARNMLIMAQFKALRESRGGKCNWPGCEITEHLEFAHVKETDLMGWGRGRKERYYDIIKNPDSYFLCCKEHHVQLDYNLEEEAKNEV